MRAGAALALPLLLLGTAAAEPGAGPDRCAPPLADPAGPGPAAPELLEAASAARRALASRPAEARRQIEGLLAVAADLEDASLRARLRIHLARSLEQLGSGRQAAEVLVRASEDAVLAADARLQSYALGYLGELYAAGRRSEDAHELTSRALLAARQADAPDAIYRWHWQRARLWVEQGDTAAAIGAYRSAVATLRSAPGLSDPDLAELYLAFVDLLLRAAAAGDPAASQALLVEARNALEDQNANELQDYFRDACLDAQRKATPDEVPGALVVYPVLLPDRTVLITSRGGALTRHAVPVGREALTAEVRSLRRLLEKRTTRQYLRPARQLYDWLIRPLESELEAASVDTLVFVPSGPLRTIPLAALHDEEKDQYLIEKVPLAITPGLTLTEPRPIDRADVRTLAAGISDAVQGYPGLANVSRELEALSQVFPARRLENAEFVTQRFESEVSARTFDIVHVASHAEFAADASQSFVLTYDGRLPMERLGELVGTTRFRERGLELLTLSACETATGDDRAALGLAGVALRAGARSALATLWSVDDEVAADLVSHFYVGLGDAGLSRAEALQRAQIQVLGRRASRHPIYWAPYLLISNWL